MKSRNWLLVAGLAIGLTACQDTTDAKGELNEDSRISNANNSDQYNDVPQATRTSFETKYPNASNVRWSKYQPVEAKTDLDDTDVRYNLDTNDYVVKFNMDNVDYLAWYDDGSWIYTSAVIPDHSKLPAVVNAMLRDKYPGYTIVEAEKENDKDRTMYEVEIEKGSDKWKLLIAENGEVIKKKGRGDNKGVKEKKDVK